MENTKQTITCKVCAEEKPVEAFYLAEGYRKNTCTSCMSDAKRNRYHTNPRARAIQLACSSEVSVKKRFPEAHTGMSSTDYAEKLLSATHCHYCHIPNDGTHPFNLDHQEALGNGGKHELSNLVPCCEPCNRAKRDMPAGVFIAWLDGVAQRRNGPI